MSRAGLPVRLIRPAVRSLPSASAVPPGRLQDTASSRRHEATPHRAPPAAHVSIGAPAGSHDRNHARAAAQRPLKSGGRFSWNAATPSWKSSEERRRL